MTAASAGLRPRCLGGGVKRLINANSASCMGIKAREAGQPISGQATSEKIIAKKAAAFVRAATRQDGITQNLEMTGYSRKWARACFRQRV